MNGGATNLLHAAVVGWAVMRHARLTEGAVTLRWERGNRTAVVLEGARAGDHSTARALGEIAVDPRGWTDHADIRQSLQAWLREHLAKVGAR